MTLAPCRACGRGPFHAECQSVGRLSTMIRLARAFTIVLVMQSAFAPDETRAQQLGPERRDSVYRQYLRFPTLVKGGRVEPNWVTDGNRFWYMEDGSDGTVTFLVDPGSDAVISLLDAESAREVAASGDAVADQPVAHRKQADGR